MMAAPSTDTRPVVGDNPVMARLQADFEELFIGAGVTLVLCGHEHAYGEGGLERGRQQHRCCCRCAAFLQASCAAQQPACWERAQGTQH